MLKAQARYVPFVLHHQCPDRLSYAIQYESRTGFKYGVDDPKKQKKIEKKQKKKEEKAKKEAQKVSFLPCYRYCGLNLHCSRFRKLETTLAAVSICSKARSLVRRLVKSRRRPRAPATTRASKPTSWKARSASCHEVSFFFFFPRRVRSEYEIVVKRRHIE